jgi:O-antigen ligase
MKQGMTLGGLEVFPSDLLCLLTAALWAAALMFGQTRLRLHPLFLLLALYFAAMAVSAWWSADRQVSAFKLLTQVYLLTLPVLAFNLVQTEADLRRAFTWWIIPAAAVGAYGVATLLLFPFLGWHSFLREPLHHFGTLPPGPYPRIELTFEYPAMLANYLGVSLMLVLLAYRLERIGRRASLASGGVLLISALFALTPGFGGVMVMLGLWVWYYERDRRPRLARAAFAATPVIVALEILVAAVTPVVGPTAPFVMHVPGLVHPLAPAVRLLAWIAAARSFFGSPLVGHGIGVNPVRVLYQAPEWSEPGYVTDAHNFLLSIAAQTGVLGVAAVAAIVWFVVGQARRGALQGNSNALLFGLSVAWLSAFGIEGLVGSFEDARHLWILLGLIAAVGRLEVPSTLKTDSARLG